jgi:hypothetical protein
MTERWAEVNRKTLLILGALGALAVKARVGNFSLLEVTGEY